MLSVEQRQTLDDAVEILKTYDGSIGLDSLQAWKQGKADSARDLSLDGLRSFIFWDRSASGDQADERVSAS